MGVIVNELTNSTKHSLCFVLGENIINLLCVVSHKPCAFSFVFFCACVRACVCAVVVVVVVVVVLAHAHHGKCVDLAVEDVKPKFQTGDPSSR